MEMQKTFKDLKKYADSLPSWEEMEFKKRKEIKVENSWINEIEVKEIKLTPEQQEELTYIENHKADEYIKRENSNQII